MEGVLTHQALRDVNDCDTFRELMASSLSLFDDDPLFHGMPEGDRTAIEDINRVRLPRGSRQVEPIFLCPTCPPMPMEVSCDGAVEP